MWEVLVNPEGLQDGDAVVLVGRRHDFQPPQPCRHLSPPFLAACQCSATGSQPGVCPCTARPTIQCCGRHRWSWYDCVTSCQPTPAPHFECRDCSRSGWMRNLSTGSLNTSAHDDLCCPPLRHDDCDNAGAHCRYVVMGGVSGVVWEGHGTNTSDKRKESAMQTCFYGVPLHKPLRIYSPPL